MAGRSRPQIAHLARPTHPAVIRRWLTIGGLLLVLTACSSATPTFTAPSSSYGTAMPDGSTPVATTILVEATATTEAPFITQSTKPNADAASVSYTHQQADGNRIVVGLGQLPNLAPIDIPLPGPASWVVALPWQEGSLWVVTLANGQALGFQVDAQGWWPVEISSANLEPGQPPILWGNETGFGLLTAPSRQASSLTHPIPIEPTGNTQVYIDTTGNLILIGNNESSSLEIDANALPDARLLSDEDGRLLFLTGPTEHYAHGVLGDAIEASSITRIDDMLSGEISALTPMPEGLVIEGIAPIWADLNGDGVREIIVTVSNAQQGAQILVFDEAGQQLAAGPAIGQGYRWRHQIAVAPFGPNGEIELVDVLTPHLGGVVEFYRWEGDRLKVVAQMPGYTSHVIGTRNLDLAAAGDFDGDGRIELLLPNQERTALGAIRRTTEGAEIAWELLLNGKMNTNLGAVTLANGSIAVGIGQENGILPDSSMGSSLLIWHP